MRIKMLSAAALVASLAAPAAWADAPAKTDAWSLSAILHDRAAKSAFDAMKKGQRLPAWVTKGATETPAHAVSFDGHDVYVMSGCKPHDCGSERIAILYDPQKKAMYGVLSVVAPKNDTEHLTWLNIGGGSESIDGKTILYAQLTGSVENHPGAFNYK
ncbi:Ivy family c-type lysozyme inhibitor [Burkholderia singularis]|uniref:Inhibitor of vertebrate lysozyme n=1 Tax=Burkholderia singularis TaxID=1503053 RepID=A0A238H448_9BURK|nr:Ivy family c-type lysozyme inhibitor [Burkholderia singularis]SMG00008.1 Inhibitor of vertebrate lysozyme precursor [Burkholderia singularis]